jgi:3-phenylpropionate/cinnamic acid dioxygenase small subunit
VTSARQIGNLLYRYGALMDAGDFAAIVPLFAHARLRLVGGQEVGAAEMLGIWQRMIILYPCGTPRTKHVITNPIIEIDEDAGKATCRSVYTVLQATDGFALQIIAAGRYHDTFTRIDGEWHFAHRDYSMLDMQGDLSHHLKDMTKGNENG